MELLLLSLILLFCLAILVVLAFLSVFSIRSQERQKSMMGDLLKILVDGNLEKPDPKFRTWDEKYELELEAIQRRIREASGLSDLP